MSVNYFFNGWNDGFREHAPRKKFTLLLWLCISINDTLFIPQYTSTCIDILEERVKRFMSATKIMIGPQREMISQIGL